MLTKILEFVKDKFNDIILIIVIGLFIMLAFALGFIIAKSQQKEPIKIEKTN